MLLGIASFYSILFNVCNWLFFSFFFFFSSRRRHTRCSRDWSSDVCSSDLVHPERLVPEAARAERGLRSAARHPAALRDADGAHLAQRPQPAAVLAVQGARP